MSPRETALLNVLEMVAAGEDFDVPSDWNQYESRKDFPFSDKPLNI